MRHWAGVPRTARLVAAVELAVLAYGTVVHLVQLAGGGLRPYPWAPAWLAAYFVSLTLLDPLAAALVWLRRAAGPYLAAAVLVTDAAANGYAVYAVPGAGLAQRVSQAVITALAVAAVAVIPFLRRATKA
jgi:hypothetical protein